ncbi:hypothetical protein [Cellulomonas triticagri]|uniref:Uncharacterized protein n=1 Tax=Cellulomonas triticagri TaxID=2483352 RepID=A0A3M2JJ80_9CELL|nr:hypothetical protein [Cellulomonas triticagri]RMI13144.1 hypothetical protein EBM89_05670 [Cellulomonas triticagri]
MIVELVQFFTPTLLVVAATVWWFRVRRRRLTGVRRIVRRVIGSVLAFLCSVVVAGALIAAVVAVRDRYVDIDHRGLEVLRDEPMMSLPVPGTTEGATSVDRGGNGWKRFTTASARRELALDEGADWESVHAAAVDLALGEGWEPAPPDRFCHEVPLATTCLVRVEVVHTFSPADGTSDDVPRVMAELRVVSDDTSVVLEIGR